MHVELILEPLADGDTQRHTSWELWHYGHRLAVSGQSYRNQADALAALERATSGRVVRFATHAPGAPPAMLVMPGEYNVEIRRRRRRVPTVAPAHTMDQR